MFQAQAAERAARRVSSYIPNALLHTSTCRWARLLQSEHGMQGLLEITDHQPSSRAEGGPAGVEVTPPHLFASPHTAISTDQDSDARTRENTAAYMCVLTYRMFSLEKSRLATGLLLVVLYAAGGLFHSSNAFCPSFGGSHAITSARHFGTSSPLRYYSSSMTYTPFPHSSHCCPSRSRVHRRCGENYWPVAP